MRSEALLLGIRFLPLEQYLILEAIALLAQSIRFRIVDVLATSGGLCVSHAQQRCTALHVLTFTDVNRGDRSTARRKILAMPSVATRNPAACSFRA